MNLCTFFIISIYLLVYNWTTVTWWYDFNSHSEHIISNSCNNVMDPFIFCALHKLSLSYSLFTFSSIHTFVFDIPSRRWSSVRSWAAASARPVTLRDSWAGTHNRALPCLCIEILFAYSSIARWLRPLLVRCCSLQQKRLGK